MKFELQLLLVMLGALLPEFLRRLVKVKYKKALSRRWIKKMLFLGISILGLVLAGQLDSLPYLVVPVIVGFVAWLVLMLLRKTGGK